MTAQTSSATDESIGGWLRQARKLAQQTGAVEIDGQIERLEAQRQMAGFRVAVVGEFCTGKSTLIGGLLGQWDLLPTGDAPTTATNITIVPGNEPSLEIVHPGAEIERRPLKRSSWSDLVNVDERGHSRAVDATVRVTVDSQWLREVDLELVDTPGIGTAAIELKYTLETLAECDMALITVAATRPFSLAERMFLEEDLLRYGGMPRVAVVVTKLDLLPEDQRETVLTSIRRKVASVSGIIPVLVAPSLNADHAEPAAEKLRTYIGSMGARSERRRLRSHHLTQLLALKIREIVALAKLGGEQASADADARAENMRSAASDVSEAGVRWHKVHTEFEERRQRTSDRLKKMLARIMQRPRRFWAWRPANRVS